MPCISCTTFRTRQADGLNTKSQMRIMARTPMPFFPQKNLEICKQTQSEEAKKERKTSQKIVLRSRFLTFVISHRLGLHGEGSHYQTHVDFCLQTGCVGVCEFVQARVRLNQRRQVLTGVRLKWVCVTRNEVSPSAGRTCATSGYYHFSCCLHAHIHPLPLLRVVCVC